MRIPKKKQLVIIAALLLSATLIVSQLSLLWGDEYPDPSEAFSVYMFEPISDRDRRDFPERAYVIDQIITVELSAQRNDGYYLLDYGHTPDTWHEDWISFGYGEWTVTIKDSDGYTLEGTIFRASPSDIVSDVEWTFICQMFLPTLGKYYVESTLEIVLTHWEFVLTETASEYIEVETSYTHSDTWEIEFKDPGDNPDPDNPNDPGWEEGTPFDIGLLLPAIALMIIYRRKKYNENKKG